MNAFQYASSLPEQVKSSYTEYDTIDFVLSFPQRAVNLGSVRLEGVLDVLKGGSAIGAGDEIYLDRFVGAHSVLESVQTQVDGNQIENCDNYARYVKMVSTATTGQGSMNNSENVCELKAPMHEMTKATLRGEVPKTQPSTAKRNAPDFSIKPKMALNSGMGSLKYSRSGDIRLSFNLARVGSVIWGSGVDATCSYSLKDLRVSYTTIPEDEAEDEVRMHTKTSLKQSIQSSLANISVKAGIMASAVSVSFLRQADENVIQANQTALNKLPTLTETQFLMNDSTNSYVSFVIQDDEELTGRYIDSFMDTGKNALSRTNLAANDGFGVGLRFAVGDGDMLDLRNNKFGLQLNSAVSSSDPFVVYMYFHSHMVL
jgi:hypothetical protein